MKQLILLTILLLFSLNISAQQDKIDSLENLLQEDIHDTIRTDVLNNLASLYQRVDADASLEKAEELLELGEKTNDTKAIAIAYQYIGVVYFYKNYGLDTILTPLEKGLKIAEQEQLTKRKISIKNSIGVIYMRFGQDDKAFAILTEVLHLAEKENLKKLASTVLTNLAAIKMKTKSKEINLEKIKAYYFKSIRYSEEINFKKDATPFTGLGNIYKKTNQLDSSIYYYNEALKIQRKYNFMYDISLTLSNMANSYARLDDYKKAKSYAREAYNISKANNLSRGISGSLMSLAGIAALESKHQKAIDYYKKALSLVQKSDHEVNQECYDKIAQNYKAIGNYKEALKYRELHQTLTDSIFTLEKEEQIQSLEIKYDVAKKDAQNEFLKKQNDNIQKAARSRTIAIIGLLLAFLFAAGFGYLLFQSNQREKELNATLEQKVKERTDELLTANQELSEIRNIKLLEAAKSRFFANVSHEFRTPLTLIQAPIEYVLNSRELSNKNYTMLSKALNNSQQLKHLVGQVLDLTKLEADKLELNETKNLFYPLVRRLVANFETYAQQKQINLRFDYQMNKNIQLKIDADKFEKILNNYLSNAIKFIPKHGEIVVLTKDSGNQIQLSVSDTGQGIPKSELNKIFERYYQAKNSLKGVNDKNHTGGTGIGLSLCADYAKLFGGKAWAESPNEAGQGSTFYFEFPKKEFFAALSSDEKEIIEAETAMIAPLPISNKNNLNDTLILIVEDNYDLSSFLSEFLTTDYSIVVKENGQEALDWLASIKTLPSLILSDIMMPKIDGFKLLETLKNNDSYRHIPVMMLTARADVQDKLKALRIGVDDYMLKPFNATELQIRIQNIIENYNNRITTINDEDATKTENELKISAEDSLWLQNLETTIENHIENLNLTADFISEKIFISRVQLFRKVKQLTGMTFNQYLNEMRLQRAKVLLETGKVTTTKTVAYKIGFKNAGYFSKLYYERFGKRPSEYF